MKKTASSFQLNASDLVGYLNCRHLSALDRKVAEGALPKPPNWDPLLEVLWERGKRHEQAYIEHLEKNGAKAVHVDGVEVTDDAVALTFEFMKEGAEIIVQGALAHDGWVGRADILRRINKPSDALGGWSYEVLDAKLARETKAGAVLQLCLYSDLLWRTQSLKPENMYIVRPWSHFEPQPHRFDDYAAYFRQVKQGLLDSLNSESEQITYPEPIEHCDICRWRKECDTQRRKDDHLCLVAGISKLQTNELKLHDIATVQNLAAMPLPLKWKPDRGSAESYKRVREQARIQVEGREAGENKHELLPIEIGFGLTRLPEPNEGDIFFDLEGDSFVGEHGLEYLFGYMFVNENGAPDYRHEWAFTRSGEKQAFENFVDFVMSRIEEFPELHIYHYGPYDPSALKRLMGRYGTREDEIDRMLRANRFVDLLQIVRQGVRASVESYSIKKLEPFYGYEREMSLHDVKTNLMTLESKLELNDIETISDTDKAAVHLYNREDCISARHLRDWLEGLRTELIGSGTDVPRSSPEIFNEGEPSEQLAAWLAKIDDLVSRLTADVPDDLNERSHEQQARWMLANTLDWHRREKKSMWWNFFRLSDLSAEDMLDERAGLSSLTFVGEVKGSGRLPTHQYAFPAQETDIRGGEELRSFGGEKFGTTTAISSSSGEGKISIKKTKNTVDIHPETVFMHKNISDQSMKNALAEFGDYAADHGIIIDGPYLAARDLLLKESPRTDGQPLRCEGETALEAAKRLCSCLSGGILPIQGPPGTGKTYTGAQMVCKFVRQGKTVGVTANSHKVIRNFLDKIIEIADENNIEELQCCHKPDAKDQTQPLHRLSFVKKNEELVNALQNNINVGGGTAWFWSHANARDLVDVLFVDEAAQMSPANVLAISQAAKTIVLIGDPQQLNQPMQGSHPDGIAVSALEYILDGAQTIPADKGLFLEESWRLHPNICAYTSELFYDRKLRSRAGTEQQIIKGTGPIAEAGLFYMPVRHTGNQNNSPEEAEAVSALVNNVLSSRTTYIDSGGDERPVTLEDVLIITPYNAQVFEIQKRLPDARVGTVDKFQGQEAPIAIYSTATSSHTDAPHGMEFLYSLERLNVAISRAQCASIIVASPEIFEAECRSPRQMQLANAFCRYLEMAKKLTNSP